MLEKQDELIQKMNKQLQEITVKVEMLSDKNKQ